MCAPDDGIKGRLVICIGSVQLVLEVERRRLSLRLVPEMSVDGIGIVIGNSNSTED
jgi:hypothetical protein